MPSPFPGFDPYLESLRYWRDFHVSYLYALRAELMRVLPPQFAARIEERLMISHQTRSLYPDVAIVQVPPPATGQGVTVLERPLVRDEPVVITLLDEAVPQRFIEVFRVNAPGEIVSTIELLSPANKAPGREGQAPYLRKQEQILQSDVHLLEIDLLRAGMHTVAISRERLLEIRGGAEWDYLVSLHRADTGIFEGWARTVREALPVVSLPLSDGFADVIVDLRAIFDRVYDDANYPRFVDYSGKADPPLSAEDVAWADRLLQAAGFRPRAQ